MVFLYPASTVWEKGTKVPVLPQGKSLRVSGVIRESFLLELLAEFLAERLELLLAEEVAGVEDIGRVGRDVHLGPGALARQRVSVGGRQVDVPVVQRIAWPWKSKD